jgi:hypothetical protein
MQTRIMLGVLALLAAALAPAQEQPSSRQTVSLGDLARQQRAQRTKVMQEKSVRVWTNDNLPARPAGGGGGVSVAGQIGSAPVAPETSGEAASGGHDEKYYRERMAELRGNLETHQRQLSVLQQKQGQAQLQYYGDPQKTLEQGSTPTFYSDVNKLQQDIEKKRQEIAEDEKAIEGLQDQLRREGHPPGWLR